MGGSDAIGIMCKLPVAGQVKTRLIPRLGAGGACLLAEALLADAVAQTLRIASRCEATPYVFYAPVGAGEAMRRLVPRSFFLASQPDADLGERMRSACATMLSREHARVLLYGTDCPTRPDEHFDLAFAGLLAADVVMSAAPDGGYGLIGLSRACDELFAPMAWSTSIVAAQTRQRAGEVGRRLHELPVWADVDTPEDLDRLIADLRGNSEEAAPPQHTRRALRALGLLP